MTCIYVCYFGTKLNTFFSVIKVYNDESLFKWRYKHWFDLLTFTNLSNRYFNEHICTLTFLPIWPINKLQILEFPRKFHIVHSVTKAENNNNNLCFPGGKTEPQQESITFSWPFKTLKDDTINIFLVLETCSKHWTWLSVFLPLPPAFQEYWKETTSWDKTRNTSAKKF